MGENFLIFLIFAALFLLLVMACILVTLGIVMLVRKLFGKKQPAELDYNPSVYGDGHAGFNRIPSLEEARKYMVNNGQNYENPEGGD